MDSVDVQVARVDQRVRNLESWQAKQNGTLQRLDDRISTIDRRINQLGWGIAATLGGVVVDLLLRINFIP